LKAIKGAQLDNFVNLTDDGMYSSVGNAGQEFSGGERQRIGLARVFLQDASIILIDEGTNALDYKTESLIYKYIKEISRNKITIVVAHRLSALQDFDEILFLKDGYIVESGTHDELKNLNGGYVDLIQSQDEGGG
jgi:ABC-type multidrug transport system fused ATPase/permease subunit